MYTIINSCTSKQIINKSVFIGYLFKAETIEEASDILLKIRKKHYDANHNCYAYIIGKSGEYYRQSDDKEPSGTAGIVILDILKKANLTNVICIVTRYFGGIKLGVGGLVRAYSSTALLTLESAIKEEIIDFFVLSFVISYELLDAVLLLLKNFEQVKASYDDKVFLSYNVPLLLKDELVEKIIEITKNKVSFLS